MKKIVLVLLLSPSVFSQWYWGWELPNGELPQNVVTVDTFVAFIAAENFYADTSFIYRLSLYNGWQKLPMSSFMYEESITCIAARDSNRIWAGTELGKIFFSTNGGLNWTLQVNTAGSGFINDIRFSDTNPDIGYANSDPPSGINTSFKIFKTTNGGYNWIEYSFSTGTEHVGAQNSSWVTDADHYWMGLYCQWGYNCPLTSMIILTTNGGINWQTKYIPNSSHFVSNVVFMSNNTYGLSTPWDVLPVNIYRSINGGNSWILNNITSHTQTITSLDWAEGTSNWYYCTSDDGAPVYKSTNNGQTWYAMETTNTEQLVSLDVKRLGSAIFGYAVSYQGSVLQLFADTISNIGIKPQGEEIPKNFILYQNYPNPFNPSTKIKFDVTLDSRLRGNDNVTLKVYDILGREITVLMNEQLKPGTYEVEWNGSNYPSGVYFYKLTVMDASSPQANPLSIKHLETKKMILIK